MYSEEANNILKFDDDVILYTDYIPVVAWICFWFENFSDQFKSLDSLITSESCTKENKTDLKFFKWKTNLKHNICMQHSFMTVKYEENI